MRARKLPIAVPMPPSASTFAPCSEGRLDTPKTTHIRGGRNAGVVTRRVVLALAVIGALVPAGAARASGCAPDGHPGGGWASFGHDLSNTRHQTSETLIGPDDVADLAPAWWFSAAGAGGYGAMQSTPVVADGCVFFATGGGGLATGSPAGAVFALDADTQEVVWRTFLPLVPTVISGIFAPAVADGRVHVLVGQTPNPFAVALDQTTGEILWRTDLVDTQGPTGINASAVVYDGLVFVPTIGGDAVYPPSRPPFYILDAATGAILATTRVIPDDDIFYGGGGIWTTAVVDTTTKHLYAGTANPYSRRLEHERTNAILKVDVDRTRATFGQIVGVYKGDVDHDPELYDTFECQTLGDLQVVYYSVFCGQQDIDFGASPNLFETSTGRRIVGELQKSGTYHAIDPDTMQPVWKAELAPPSAGGNTSSSAVDATSVYVATNRGMFAVDKDTGVERWYNPNGRASYRPVTLANGVLYLLDGDGAMLTFDASTGASIERRQVEAPGATCTNSSPSNLGGSSGVAVARNTVFVGCDYGSDNAGMLFAYRL